MGNLLIKTNDPVCNKNAIRFYKSRNLLFSLEIRVGWDIRRTVRLEGRRRNYSVLAKGKHTNTLFVLKSNTQSFVSTNLLLLISGFGTSYFRFGFGKKVLRKFTIFRGLWRRGGIAKDKDGLLLGEGRSKQYKDIQEDENENWEMVREKHGIWSGWSKFDE